MTKNIEEILTSRSVKPTAMRLLVLQELVASPTAMSLLDIESKFYQADRTTLFRTLKTFESKKLIHSIQDGSGAVKYALCEESCLCLPQDQHVHFHCEKCQETFCFSQTKVPIVQIPVGFRAKSTNMVFKGICINCA